MTVAELLATLPPKIKIGSLTYAMEVVEKIDDEDDSWGHCMPAEATIRVIGRHPTPAHLVDTVLHELFHAVWAERGLHKPRENEERAVQALSAGTTALLRDNPKLHRWINRGLKKQ
jgi:hypothetical protein